MFTLNFTQRNLNSGNLKTNCFSIRNFSFEFCFSTSDWVLSLRRQHRIERISNCYISHQWNFHWKCIMSSVRPKRLFLPKRLLSGVFGIVLARLANFLGSKEFLQPTEHSKKLALFSFASLSLSLSLSLSGWCTPGWIAQWMLGTLANAYHDANKIYLLGIAYIFAINELLSIPLLHLKILVNRRPVQPGYKRESLSLGRRRVFIEGSWIFVLTVARSLGERLNSVLSWWRAVVPNQIYFRPPQKIELYLAIIFSWNNLL